LLGLAVSTACGGSSRTEATKAGAGQATGAPAGQPATAAADDEFPEIPPGPVATVGENEISREAFVTLYRPLLARTKRDDLPRSMKGRFQGRVLERLVYGEQLRLEAASTGVDYDPAKLEERWATRRAKYEKWQEHLEKSAETEQTLRQSMINDLREEVFVDKRVNLTITEEDLQKAYDEAKPMLTSERERLRAAHLMILVAPRTADQKLGKLSKERFEAASEADKKAWQEAALVRAKALRAEALKPGTDFFQLAREQSEGPGASRGGDMGYFDEMRMIPAYTKAAMALKIGQISQPVLTERGYFVIKLIDRQPPGTIPFEVMKENIADTVRVRRRMQTVQELKQELERKSPSRVLLKLEQPGKGRSGAGQPKMTGAQ
jgi:parvulin-like peptidyl-prolyl isomerase